VPVKISGAGADRAIVFGELYLIEQSAGPVVWQVRKLPPDGFSIAGPHVMLCPLNNTRFGDAVAEANRRGTSALELYRSDGPVPLPYLAPRVVGRVVGVYQAPETAIARILRHSASRRAT